MMKNISLVLNAVLLVAVAVLYFLHFSSDKKTIATPAKVLPANGSSVPAQASIGYVDLDSLNENIVYIKTKRKELEGEQRAIETEWENGYRNLENQKNNFLKRGDAITQEEAERFQASLIQQQQQIDGKKQNATQRLSEKSFKFLEDIQKELKTFLEEYNKQRNFTYILTTGTGLDYMVYKDSSLNITNDVIAGMNEIMKSKK